MYKVSILLMYKNSLMSECINLFKYVKGKNNNDEFK